MAPSDALKRVAILQGNATVAQLMSEFLKNTASFDVEHLQGSPPGAARAQLAIIDVDSGIEVAEQWIHHCDGRQLPVLVSGVASSQSAYSDRPWLSRPFTASQLVRLCRELIGEPSSDEEEEVEPVPPPAIEVEPDAQRKPTVEIPGDIASDQADVTPTQEDLPTVRANPDELLDVIDLDGSASMILEVEEVANAQRAGGELLDLGERRNLGIDELVEENPWADEPDTAVDLHRESEEAPSPKPPSRDSSSGSAPALQSEVTAISPLGDMSSNDFSGAHRVASLVAEHWDRLGLTARPTDRADRLQRVLTAMLRKGLDGVLDELKRIPPVSGFSGCLETMPVVDLLHTIRDRRLRGRLEIGLDGHSFVLYIERTTLQGIDSLGENTAGLLIEFLNESGALDEQTYRHYQQLVTELSGEPLEMKLRRDGLVDESMLVEAKKERARYLLGKMCRGTQGTFAFIEIPREGGQSWPTKGLNLNVDALLLELLRQGKIDPDHSGPVTRSDLVMDVERASRLEPEALTDSERRMLEFFENRRSIDSARDVLGDSDESVDSVIRRLKRLELLRRLGQESDSSQRKPTRRTSVVDVAQESTESPGTPETPTAVESSWDLEILDEVEPDEATVSEERPGPMEAGPEEETHQDVGFSVGVPDEYAPNQRDSDDDASRQSQVPSSGAEKSTPDDDSQ